jgi:hypothetical protein
MVRAPAFRRKRPRLLVLIVATGRKRIRQAEDLAELTLTLNQAWTENSTELRRGSARDAFDELLNHVVTQNVPEALELADRVLRP